MTAKLLRDLLLGRRTHCSDDDMRYATWTAANAVTALRAVATAALLVAAVQQDDRRFLIAALVVSFAGDLLDGTVARRYGCETEKGAQFDALADRLTAVAIVVGTLAIGSATTLETVAAVVVWIQFGMVDLALSFQFLKHDLWSADEFHRVNESVWIRNWSPAAKLASNVPLALLVAGGLFAVVAIAVAVALIGARVAWNPAARTQRAADMTVHVSPATHPRRGDPRTNVERAA